MELDARFIIQKLGLKPLPGEGGFFREIYRSDEKIPASALPPRYGCDKHIATSIFYLLTPDCFSAIHRIKSDEIFHFYLGDPVIMLMLYPDGKAEKVVIGNKIDEGQQLQHIVPAGVWQGSYLIEDGKYALMGTTVAPGFDFSDFELGLRKDLISKYPKYAHLIERLTIQ